MGEIKSVEEHYYDWLEEEVAKQRTELSTLRDEIKALREAVSWLSEEIACLNQHPNA